MPAYARDRSIVYSAKRRRSGSGSLCFHQQLVEQLETEINLFVADMQRRCKRDDIFVVAANVEYQADFPASVFELARESDLDHLVYQSLARSEPVRFADFG